eukprot:scaffold51535_cov63-Phaeocystis_antarctica.AAC.2
MIPSHCSHSLGAVHLVAHLRQDWVRVPHAQCLLPRPQRGHTRQLVGRARLVIARDLDQVLNAEGGCDDARGKLAAGVLPQTNAPYARGRRAPNLVAGHGSVGEQCIAVKDRILEIEWLGRCAGLREHAPQLQRRNRVAHESVYARGRRQRPRAEDAPHCKVELAAGVISRAQQRRRPWCKDRREIARIERIQRR